MDITISDVSAVKSEPETILEEESTSFQRGAILQYGIVKQEIEDASEIKREYELDLINSDVVVVKSEPDTTLKEENPTFHCDLILQYGISKQEIEDAPVIKCEPETPAAEEYVQESGAYSEIDIVSPDIKKKCFDRIDFDRIEQSREFISSKSSTISRKRLKSKQSVNSKRSSPGATCTFRCSDKTMLVKPIKTHTGEKLLSCSECTYMCSYKSTMIRHIRTHTGEKPLSCSKCTYRCIRNVDLVVHSRTHTGEKPFSCSECTYRCSSMSRMAQHIRTHARENPFSCSECTHKCSSKSKMAQHIRTHTGEKPLSCSECNYRCSYNSTMLRHVRTHTGEKPFSCSECTYRCIRRSTMTRHITTHTGENPH